LETKTGEKVMAKSAKTTLRERVEVMLVEGQAVSDKCEVLIDELALMVRDRDAPTVPLLVVRNTLTARSGGNPFRALMQRADRSKFI
jgi:hypothetical protein